MSGSYTEQVREHFTSPKNLGVVSGSTGVGEVGNIVCGDTVKMHVRVAGGRVEDAKFQTYGCVYSIACADVVAELAKEKPVEEAEAIGSEAVVSELGGVPESKKHCAVMAVNALRAALKKSGRDVELICGGREITEDMKVMSIIPLSTQKTHRVAEMFDEFIIPEMEKKGIDVELLEVSIESHEVKFTASSSACFVKSYAEKLLRKFIDETLILNPMKSS
jgi:NifU-like protein involved in Fe-S cluster formation